MSAWTSPARQVIAPAAGAGTNPYTVTYPGAVLAGSLLIATISWGSGSGSVSACSDNLNGPWTLGLVTQGQGRSVVTYYLNNSAAGTPTLSFTLNAAQASNLIAALELVGPPTGIGQSGPNSAVATTTPVTGTITPNSANSLLYAALRGGTVSAGAGGSWVGLATGSALGVQYNQPGTTTAIAGSWTTASAQYAAQIIEFVPVTAIDGGTSTAKETTSAPPVTAQSAIDGGTSTANESTSAAISAQLAIDGGASPASENTSTPPLSALLATDGGTSIANESTSASITVYVPVPVNGPPSTAVEGSSATITMSVVGEAQVNPVVPYCGQNQQSQIDIPIPAQYQLQMEEGPWVMPPYAQIFGPQPPSPSPGVNLQPRIFGVVSLLKGANAIPYDIVNELSWPNPNLQACVLRIHWSTLQPSATTYDWSFLDLGLRSAQAHGKPLAVTVIGGVDGIPGWVYAAGAKPLVLSTGIIPLPWDPTFQSLWQLFLNAFGARYEGKLAYMQMWGMSSQGECYFCKTADDVNQLATIAGDVQTGLDLWTQAGIDITGFYVQALPTTLLYWASGAQLPPALYPDTYNSAFIAMMNTVLPQYPQRVGFKSNGLYAGSHGWVESNAGLWVTTNPVGYQTTSDLSLDPLKTAGAFQNAADSVAPLSPPTRSTFIEFITTAANAEVLQPTIIQYNQLLTTPVAPAPVARTQNRLVVQSSGAQGPGEVWLPPPVSQTDIFSAQQTWPL